MNRMIIEENEIVLKILESGKVLAEESPDHTKLDVAHHKESDWSGLDANDHGEISAQWKRKARDMENAREPQYRDQEYKDKLKKVKEISSVHSKMATKKGGADPKELERRHWMKYDMKPEEHAKEAADSERWGAQYEKEASAETDEKWKKKGMDRAQHHKLRAEVHKEMPKLRDETSKEHADWWDKLSKHAKEMYLNKHPNSTHKA